MVNLDAGILANLETYRGTLAYLAVSVRGECEGTTAYFGEVVNCQTAVMREGLEELSRLFPDVVKKGKKAKWVVGSGKAAEEGVQILDSIAGWRHDFIDDLKKYWDWGNPGRKFTMNGKDGKQIAMFLKEHKDWTQETWRKALRNRCMSEVNHAQPLWVWVGRLAEYSATPIDRFGKPMPNGVGGKHGEAITREQGNRSAREQAVADAHA